MTDELKFLTTGELADTLHVTTRTLKLWRSEGRGPAWVKAESRVLYPIDEVKRYLKESQEAA